MQVNGEYILREIAGDYILVPVGESAMEINGLITLNEIGVLIWREIERKSDQETILQRIMKEYDVDEETARTDLMGFLQQLEEAKMINRA